MGNEWEIDFPVDLKRALSGGVAKPGYFAHGKLVG